MFEDTSAMKDFGTKQGFLFYSYPLCEEERKKIDGIGALLDRCGVAELVSSHVNKGAMGRPPYDPFRLFEMILLGFSLGASSLREMESS